MSPIPGLVVWSRPCHTSRSVGAAPSLFPPSVARGWPAGLRANTCHPNSHPHSPSPRKCGGLVCLVLDAWCLVLGAAARVGYGGVRGYMLRRGVTCLAPPRARPLRARAYHTKATTHSSNCRINNIIYPGCFLLRNQVQNIVQTRVPTRSHFIAPAGAGVGAGAGAGACVSCRSLALVASSAPARGAAHLHAQARSAGMGGAVFLRTQEEGEGNIFVVGRMVRTCARSPVLARICASAPVLGGRARAAVVRLP